MSRLAARLLGTQTQAEPNLSAPPSPLVSRLCDALTHLGAADPKMSLVVGGFVKHLTRNPPADAEIVSTLEWLQSMIDGVLTGEGEPVSLPEVAVG